MQTPPSPPTVPLLSILCLSFNHADFIATAMESFLAQETDFDVEIVVSDDCSTDETLAVVGRYRARLGDRLQLLVSSVNLGVTRNFRRALQACRGRYVALCEGDDFWRGRSKLQQQVDFLEAHPDFVLTFHDATVVDKTGELGAAHLPPRLQCDASADELVGTRSIATLTVCFRNVLRDLPPELDHAPVLDMCLWSLLGQHGGGKYLGGIEPAGYRVHQGGIYSMQSETTRLIMTAQSLLCLARIYERQGRTATSNQLLYKALNTASVPVSLPLRWRLIAANMVRALGRRPLRWVRSLPERRRHQRDRAP